MQRLHLLKNDLDWLPTSFKVVRWTVAGAVWTTAAAVAGALVAVSPGESGALGGMAKALIVTGLYAGDRAARSVLRRRLRKLARGQLEVSRLRQAADGELIHVRGRVRGRDVLPGLVDTDARAVYRRVHLQLDQLRIVHEAAVDFALVDESGESIIVEVAGARLVGPEARLRKLPAIGPEVDRLLALALPSEAQRWLGKRAKKIARGHTPARPLAGESLVREGDEIEVLGYKNRTVDVSVEARLERDTPMRATLRAGRDLPLILSPALR